MLLSNFCGIAFYIGIEVSCNLSCIIFTVYYFSCNSLCW